MYDPGYRGNKSKTRQPKPERYKNFNQEQLKNTQTHKTCNRHDRERVMSKTK